MGRETRQQILSAAQSLIQTKGLARVTTKELARKTGLSEGALYRHFGRKQDVFLAILEKQLPSFLEALNQHVAGTGTVSGNLTEILLAVMSYYEQLIPLTASFFADTDLLARFRQLLDRIGGPQRLYERVAAYIEEEQRRGRIQPALPALSIATLLLGPGFQYVFLRQLLGHDPFNDTDRQFAEKLVEVLTRGILPTNPLGE